MNSTLKVVIFVIILLVVITGFGVYTLKVLDSSSKKLEDHINLIEDNIKKNEWDKAQQNLSIITDKWNSTQKQWAMLIDHIEIDNIDESLSKMTSYIEEQDKNESLAEVSVLKKYINHIPVRESPILRNIF